MKNKNHYTQAARKAWEIMSQFYPYETQLVSTQRIDWEVFNHIREHVPILKENHELDMRFINTLYKQEANQC